MRPWRKITALGLIGAALVLNACGDASRERPETPPSRTTIVAGAKNEPRVPLPRGAPPEKLVARDLKEGYGVAAEPGDELTMKLVAFHVTGGRFESSWDQGSRPFEFRLGAEESSPGWERGIPGMRVGGRRELIVPPRLASRFGPIGNSPEDALVYVVELIGVAPPELANRREPNLSAPSGPAPRRLEVRDLIRGSGPRAEVGDLLTVEYVGIHYDGKPFSNSWRSEKPFRFQLGAGSVTVNRGWERGLRGMRVGGRRELVIPSKLLQTSGAALGGKLPASLVYVIDLVGLTETPQSPAPAA